MQEVWLDVVAEACDDSHSPANCNFRMKFDANTLEVSTHKPTTSQQACPQHIGIGALQRVTGNEDMCCQCWTNNHAQASQCGFHAISKVTWEVWFQEYLVLGTCMDVRIN